MTIAANLGAGAPLDGIAGIASACAGTDPLALFETVDHYARGVLGHTLCTINRFDAERTAVVRLYSSNPQAYPPGGSKNKAGTPWGRHVLLEHRIFVGEGSAAIGEFFDDHGVIEELGLRSVINIPAMAGGVCLGTVNFLMTRDSVSADHVAFAQLAGLLVVPAFLALASRAAQAA
jgi:GAF domain-containing protein